MLSFVANTPWTKSKVLFYLTRYLVFFDYILIFWRKTTFDRHISLYLSPSFADQFGDNMSVGLCKRVYEVSTFLIEVGIVIAEG